LHKGDLTNFQKAIEDQCSRVFFKDDCQVVEHHSTKHWAESLDMTGVWVQIDLIRPKRKGGEADG